MKVIYQKSFDKDFIKLSVKIQDQFYSRIELFIEDKYNVVLNNHSVDPTYPGCRSINITGDYRAIFSEQGDVVTFVAIGTHSQLY